MWRGSAEAEPLAQNHVALLTKLIMNRWIFRATVFWAAILLAGCAHQVLEVKDVGNFQASRVNSSPTEIRLSGLVLHSALGVDEINTQQTGESLQVLVYLTLATKEKTGNLDYTLVIPDSVNTVVFGNDKTVIWTRQDSRSHEEARAGWVERKRNPSAN